MKNEIIYSENYYAKKNNGLWWTYDVQTNERVGYAPTKQRIVRSLQILENRKRGIEDDEDF